MLHLFETGLRARQALVRREAAEDAAHPLLKVQDRISAIHWARSGGLELIKDVFQGAHTVGAFVLELLLLR
jgi:hypothetical protein